ncbi:hypothetical protein OB920_20655 [Halobacteria archaeon HArc-gm2]|nr:hypothetical protein [Halobacteria archaeon HArc-gm2]
MEQYPDVEIGSNAEVNGLSVADNNGNSVSFGDMADGETATKRLDVKTSSSSLEWSGSGGGSIDYSLKMQERSGSEDLSIDVDGDGTADVSYTAVLVDGETTSAQVGELAVGSGPAQVSLTSGTVDAEVTYTEHTVTRDPVVYVNGNKIEYTGELSPEQTASLSTDTGWIQDGSNNVTVRVGDGTLSSDAPDPSVDLNYSHSAEEQIDTQYISTGWEESYNVSHTFRGDQQNAELRIPFSQEVYNLEYVEQSVNGGSWVSVPSQDWELQNGTRLVVQLDDGDATAGVEAGDTIAIRTAGYKVQAVNGEITVVDPTTPEDDGLDTGFRVDFKSAGFHLEIGGTRLGNQVHYTHTESWENPDESVVVNADGQQDLYLPNPRQVATSA